MPEIADVFLLHWDEYCKEYSPNAAEHKIAHAIMNCRTAALGGHLLECSSCHKQEISYNSCRNRHCPKCQGSKSAEWVAKRGKDLLPVGYFHTIFTLPQAFHLMAKASPRVIYDIFFKAVNKTLLTVTYNKYRCSAGVISVLHTWGSALTFHPHIHCLIPGCGINNRGRGKRFHIKRYFVSDRVLSRVFRGIFISLLKKAYRDNKLNFEFDDIEAFLDTTTKKSWVIKTKPPFAGPHTVLKYLARYTHKVAISNKRIIAPGSGGGDQSSVTFSYKDYRSGGTQKVMRIGPLEFIRRFLQHRLPHSFVRIRHAGLLARQKKEETLAILRRDLGAPPPPLENSSTDFNPHSRTCKHCKSGSLISIAEFPPLLHSLSPPVSH